MTISVRPDSYAQFGSRRSEFCVVVSESLAGTLEVAPSQHSGRVSRVVAAAGQTLAQLLHSTPADDAAILVLADDDRLLSASPPEIGAGRTIAAVRAQNPADAQALLDAMAATRPDEQQLLARGLRDTVGTAPELRFVNGLTGADLTVSPAGSRWSENAGYFVPGRVQLAPTGSLRLTLSGPDGGARTMSGRLAVKGWPVVRSPMLISTVKRAMYERMLTMTHHPLVLGVVDGSITKIEFADGGSDLAAAALEALFTDEPGYRQVTGFEFGLNPGVPLLRDNCESNLMRTEAVASVVLGELPGTAAELVLPVLADRPVQADPAGQAAGSGRRRMNRVMSASCGCH